MKHSKAFLLTPLACASALAFAQNAVLPTGGTITRGTGSISSSGTSMTVRQTSDRMVADWQSFSIGAGNTVRFVQPGRDSVALNRVLGNDASTIYGNLTANGHVFLQNPNGVLFAPGAQVDVGALVATTLNTDVGAFMAGQLRLSGNAAGSVRNEGTLRAAEGGYVVLAAPQVSNAGQIVAPGGTAALAAGSAVEIDPTGSGLLSIRVPLAAIAAKLENSGAISADGGRVALQVAAADAALNTVMQVGGLVRARSIEQRDGQILLSGGSSGVVRVSGTLDASGGTGLAGGTVKVLGERVGLLGHARIDASGDTGGGTVLVGGNYQGKGPEANAELTVVGAQASIDVSARGRGDGGTAIVWADGETRFEGRIAARGGAAGGQGGFAEVSGKQHLDFRGAADLRAPAGQRGKLLLDPSSLIINNTADVNGDGTTGDDLLASPLLAGDFAGANLPSQITADRVATLLAAGDVLLQSQFSLTVNAPVTVAAGGAPSTLTLNSASVNVNAALTLNNSSLAIDTGGGFSDTIGINAAIQSLGSVSLTATSIGIDAVITANQVNLNSPNNQSASVTQGATGGLVAAQVTAQAVGDATLDLNLTSTLNRMGSLTLSVGNADVRNDNPAGTPMSLQGDVFGDLTVTASGGLTQSAALTVSADTQITTLGTDAALLTNAGNQFFGPFSFNTAGNLSLAAQGPLQIGGGGQGDVLVTVTGGTLTLDASGIATTGALIDLSGAGFINAGVTGGGLTTGAGGRFIIRSSDFTQDSFGSILNGTGTGNVNGIVYGGWTGALPAAGNLYVTNQTGTLDTPAGDQSSVSKTYDGSTTFNYTQNGATATGLLDLSEGSIGLGPYTVTNATGNFATKNAGTDKAYTVDPSTDTVATGSAGELHYGLQFAGFTRAAGPGVAASVVTPRALTASGITAVDRVYDATSLVALDTGTAVLNNTVAGDTVALSATGATGTMADKNVGSGKAVTVASLSLTGTDAGNYTVTNASSPTVTITPLAISASGVAAVDRVYDATTAVALNTTGATLNGVLGSDVVTIVGGSGTMADKNVGTNKPVNAGLVTLGGADAANYTVSAANATTVDITPLGIGVAGVAAVDRVYNGLTTVALNTGAATLSGVLGTDVVTVSAGSGTMADKNVGTGKPVSASVTLGGADGANYSVSAVNTPTVDITPLAITATGLTGVDRVYNGSAQVTLDTSAATLNGVLAGDAVALGTAVGSMADKNVGTDKPVTPGLVQITGADAANYAVSITSAPTVTITPLAITSSGITGVNRVYDGGTAVTLNGSAATLTGVVTGDVVTLSTAGATGTMADKNVGTNKPVVVTLGQNPLSGADAGNYTVTDNSTATVDISALTLQASGLRAINRVVNGSTVVELVTDGLTLPGVVAGDSVALDASGAVGNVSSPDPGTAKPVSVSGIVLTGADAANYTVSPLAVGSNGEGLTVRILTVAQGAFEDVRFTRYLQGLSDAQEPFRRAMAEALAAGFGKENIRKQLSRGLVFETGLAAPAVDNIESARRADSCTAGGGANAAALGCR